MNLEIPLLFDELADLPPSERERYFAAHTVDADTRREVEALLAFDDRNGRIHEIVRQAMDVAFEEPPRSLAGTSCGPYRLLALIGRGGMGSVYLAERADGEVRQRVAIKFLRFGGGDPVLRRRFLQERQILATLNHPGIARLLDAGHTADGQPYVVMDHIDGIPVDVYSERLDLRDKLTLFLKICEAVSYAHRHLVVHRDIKPSNILVDAAGEPKLLDFGIAKLLADESGATAATLFTGELGGPLTPEYAAPEQLTGAPVTTTTDVYSLGVLLFMLLTGSHPAGPGPHSTAGLVKAIVETEPPRLSQAAAHAKLGRLLRGDLDTIVAKAIKKDPPQRYPAVSALADDLRRYLKHLPIAARPDTLAYRAARFVRRNRVAVALAAAAIVASAAGVVATLVEAHTARSERDFALRQLARAEAINNLNTFLLADAAPSGKPFTVDDLLARAEHIVQRQRGDIAGRAERLISIGREYTVQDEYAKAANLLEEAYRLSRGLPGPSTRARAACALAQTLSRTGQLPRAEALYREGIGGLPDEPRYVPDRVFCLLRGSEIARNHGSAQDELARAQAAQDLLQRPSPFHSVLLDLDTAIALAGAYRVAGRQREAGEAFDRAAATLAELGRDDTQRAATVFNNWGAALLTAGRPLEAEKVLRRVIALGRDAQGEATVSPMSLVNYARALFELGRLDEAADYCERGDAKARQAGDRVPASQALLLRAAVLRARGDPRSAEQTLLAAESMLRPMLPPGHIAFASLTSLRSLDAQALGDTATALNLANQAVAIADASVKAGREGAEYLPVYLTHRADIELALGRPQDAAADAARALSAFEPAAAPGTFSTLAGRAYLALARAREAQGRRQDARAAFQSAALHLQNALGPDHPDARAALQHAAPPAP